MSLIREYTDRILGRVSRKINKAKINQKFVSSVLSLAIGFNIVAIPIAKGEIPNESKVQTNIALNLESHKILEIKKGSSEIITGESQIDKQIRIQTEGAKRIELEKARIEAENKKKQAVAQAALTSRIVDPSDFGVIYSQAGQAYGVDPRLLRAVHLVETGGSGSTNRSSYAGAIGPMQFLPSTFRAYGVDGNGDGKKDITNVVDAIFSAAKYLKACGYPDVKKALWGYNPSKVYYTKVMSRY